MGGYIKLDKDIEDDPRVFDLAEALFEHWISKVELVGDHADLRAGATLAIIGGLVTLWRYADTHIDRNDTLRARYTTLAAVTRLPLQILRRFPSEWLVENGDGTVTLPGYTDKNALLDKESRREKTRKRVADWRRKQRQKNGNADVTRSNKPKHNNGVTTGTGTGTTRTETGTDVRADASASPEGAAAPRSDKTFSDTYRERFGVDPASLVKLP